MKMRFLFATLITAAVFSSCKKDESDDNNTNNTNNNTPTVTYVISKDSTSEVNNPNNTEIRLFDYNSNKKLVRVQYKWGTSPTFNERDTIFYNANGQILKVERYYTGSNLPIETNVYTYVAGVLTSVQESGTNNNGLYNRTRTFTYAAGKLTSQTLVYVTGTPSDDGPENITSIMFTGNNMTSADVAGIGNVTLTWDLTASNPYYGLNFRSNDFLNMFNPNNVLQAFLTSDPTQKFVDNTYTYANGRVATITNTGENSTRVTTITYKAL